MRTISNDQAAVLGLSSRSEHLRVQVKDSGGTWRDLTTYPGFNAVKSVSIKEDPDSPGASADIILRQAHGKLSLAPLMTASALNRGFNPAASYAPLLAIGREVKVEVAVIPRGRTPVGGDWMTLWHGRIDLPDAGGGESVSLACRDLSGKLMDTWFKKERVYAHGAVSGLPVSMRIWEPGGTYAVGEYVLPTEAKRAGAPNFYKCTAITTGVTGTTEPTWPGSGTVADSGVTWTYQAATSTSGYPVEQVMQNLLDDALGAGVVTLYVPTSPSFNLKPWHQTREPLMPALRKAALCFGGDVRYLWRSGTSQFELTLIVVNRSPGSTVRTFDSSQWQGLPRLAQDIQGMRNSVDLIYSDSADLDPTGTPKRKLVTKKNTTSISSVYELWMEFNEADTSPINTTAEAEAMAQAAVDDLSTPDVDQSMDLVAGFPWVELRDYYQFSADGQHYDSAQSLAVHSYEHHYEAGALRTTIHCRGKPSAGRARWHEASTHPAIPPSFKEKGHRLQLFNTLSGPTASVTPIIGGGRIDIAAVARHKQAFMEEYEYHLSASAGFTPSSSTLIGISAARTMEVTKLVPGKTYYTKMVPIIRNAGMVVRGEPSAELSFTAGRANTGHVNIDTEWGRLPLNGGFETQTDPNAIFDHWNLMSATAWATNAIRLEDGSGISGGAYLKLVTTNGTDSAGVYSAYFPVEASTRFRFGFWRKCVAGTHATGLQVAIIYYDKDKGFVSSADELFVSLSDNVGTWTQSRLFGTSPSNARYCRISVAVAGGASGREVHIDSLRYDRRDDAQEDWVAPTLLNSWVNHHTDWEPAGYYKDSAGRVHLRGLVKDGTLSANLFLLPDGYRPSKHQNFAVATAGGAAMVDVYSSGYVFISGGCSSTWTSICGISFRAA